MTEAFETVEGPEQVSIYRNGDYLTYFEREWWETLIERHGSEDRVFRIIAYLIERTTENGGPPDWVVQALKKGQLE